MNYDLIIIGAGAAGLSAAITFSRKCSGKVLVIESNDEAGRKLLATGNGRCNITNERAPGYNVSKDFFESLGIAFAAEADGRIYPMSRQAKVVRDTLVRAAEAAGVKFMFGAKVAGVRRGSNDDFTVTVNGKDICAMQVIVATGGKAGSQYGSTGDGFAFARGLGLAIDMILPSLTFLKYDEAVLSGMSALKGVRVKSNALLIINGADEAEASGEVQFTDKALSGICIFDLSASYNNYKSENGDIHEAVVALDLAPGMKESEIAALIEQNGEAGISGIVNDRLAVYIDKLTESLSGEERIRRIVDTIKYFEVPVSGTGGWKEAQTTYGGVSMSELDEKYFEAVKVPGIYFAGEVISSNFPCGGFNLDFAWNTGRRTGARAAGYYNALQNSRD